MRRGRILKRTRGDRVQDRPFTRVPQNPNYKLNASQILLTGQGFSDKPESISEARGYLDSIDLEHTGRRWRLYRKLKEYLPDE